MRNIDAGMITELESEVAKAFWLFELRLNSIYRWNNSDIDLYSGANKYSKMQFEIKEIQQSAGFSVDKITVEFANVDLQLSSILLGEDVTNKPAILSYMMLDSDNVEVGTAQFFSGFISGWRINEQRAEISIVNKFMLWRKTTLRLPTDSCPWVFKGFDENLIKDPYFLDSSYWSLTATYATIDTTGTYSEDDESVLRLVAHSGTYIYGIPQKGLSRFKAQAGDLFRVKLRAYLSSDLDDIFFVQFNCYNSAGATIQYPGTGSIGTANGTWQDLEAVVEITNDADIVSVRPGIYVKNTATTGEARINSCQIGRTACGYNGAETWCDQSLERCKLLSNYDNFGGRKFILSLEDKQIYWGPMGT